MKSPASGRPSFPSVWRALFCDFPSPSGEIGSIYKYEAPTNRANYRRCVCVGRAQVLFGGETWMPDLGTESKVYKSERCLFIEITREYNEKGMFVIISFRVYSFEIYENCSSIHFLLNYLKKKNNVPFRYNFTRIISLKERKNNDFVVHFSRMMIKKGGTFCSHSKRNISSKKKKEERTVNFRSSNSSSILTCKRGMRPLDFTNTRQTREFFSLSIDRTSSSSIFRGICRARVSISHTVAWKPGVLITRGKGGWG